MSLLFQLSPPKDLSILSEGKLIVLSINKDLAVNLFIESWVTWIVIAFFGAILIWQLWKANSSYQSYEIDQAEIGIGNQKFTLKPNETDKQIAYKIWIELSTRKIGLEIDLEHDVISEIYDSWHTYFTVTRELIKDIPVRKFRRPATEKIVGLSIEVLNEGLRPHLTKWQARFRRWYERQALHEDFAHKTPQEIQQDFPKYAELSEELIQVNKKLISYRKKMRQLVG